MSAAVPPVLKIGIAANQDHLARGWNGIEREALFGKHLERNGIERNLAQAGGMIFAATRIAIDFVDQVLNGVLAVADHLGRLALCGGNELVADHQQAEIAAAGVLFDDDARAFFASRSIGGHHLLLRAQIRGHAAALIAVLRFNDHRQANFAGGFPGIVGAFDWPAFGHRHADRLQQRASQVLCLERSFRPSPWCDRFPKRECGAASSPNQIESDCLRSDAATECRASAARQWRRCSGPSREFS